MFLCPRPLSLSRTASGGPWETAAPPGTAISMGVATAVTTVASGEGPLFCPLTFRLKNEHPLPGGCHSIEHTLLELSEWVYSLQK